MIVTTLLSISVVTLLLGAVIIYGQHREIRTKDMRIDVITIQRDEFENKLIKERELTMAYRMDLKTAHTDIENAKHTISVLEDDLSVSHKHFHALAVMTADGVPGGLDGIYETFPIQIKSAKNIG